MSLQVIASVYHADATWADLWPANAPILCHVLACQVASSCLWGNSRYIMHFSLNTPLHLYGPAPHAMWVDARGLVPHADIVSVCVCLIWKKECRVFTHLIKEHCQTELGSAHTCCLNTSLVHLRLESPIICWWQHKCMWVSASFPPDDDLQRLTFAM